MNDKIFKSIPNSLVVTQTTTFYQDMSWMQFMYWKIDVHLQKLLFS